MPIRPEFRHWYRADWQAISVEVREAADRRCRRCARPHGADILQLADGRWLDPVELTWRDDVGAVARAPDLVEMAEGRMKRVRVAAAHVNHRPWDRSDENLAAWCGRCHLRHDRPMHQAVRRFARAVAFCADLFEGPYPSLVGLLASDARRPDLWGEQRALEKGLAAVPRRILSGAPARSPLVGRPTLVRRTGPWVVARPRQLPLMALAA